MIRTRTLAVPAAAAVLLLAAAGCKSTDNTVNTTAAGQSAAGTQTAAPAASGAKKAGLGDTIDLKGPNSGDLLEVTVVKIVDPDSSTDGFSSPPAGDRYVSVQFRLLNKGTGAYSDDPQIDVTAKDAAGQSFKLDFGVTTAAGAQLDSSTHLAPGDKALGFVTFDVPTGAKITQVQYALNAGMYGATGEWAVG